jgi:hypothetical protein
VRENLLMLPQRVLTQRQRVRAAVDFSRLHRGFDASRGCDGGAAAELRIVILGIPLHTIYSGSPPNMPFVTGAEAERALSKLPVVSPSCLLGMPKTCFAHAVGNACRQAPMRTPLCGARAARRCDDWTAKRRVRRGGDAPFHSQHAAAP